MIDRFDTADFPTPFAAQITDFDNEGIVDKKNARRMDCLQYALVSGNKALMDAGLTDDMGAWTRPRLASSRLRHGRPDRLPGRRQGPRREEIQEDHPFFIPYAITNMGGALLAIEKGFWDPTTPSHRVRHRQLRLPLRRQPHPQGEADIMIAGGSGRHHPRGSRRLRRLPNAHLNDDNFRRVRARTRTAAVSSWVRAPVSRPGVPRVALKRGARIHAGTSAAPSPATRTT